MNQPQTKFEINSDSETDTFKLGLQIGSLVCPSTVIGLQGTLGAGKTKLTQGIVTAVLERDEVVVSPTFTLCIPYSGRVELWHLDAYRITSDDEYYELGMDEAVDDGTVVIVEWIEKIRHLMPLVDLDILLEHESENQRKLTLHAQTELGNSLVRELM